MTNTIKLSLITNNIINISELNDEKIYNEENPYYSRVPWGMEWLNKHICLNNKVPFRTVYKPDKNLSSLFADDRPLSIVTLDVPKDLVLLIYENIFTYFICYNEIFLGDINKTGEGIKYTKDQVIDTWDKAIYNIDNPYKEEFEPFLQNKTIIGMIPYFYKKWINKIIYFPKNKNDKLICYLEELEINNDLVC